MENIKSYILKTCCRLKKFLLDKWTVRLVACVLFICLKWPFKVLIDQLGFILGYYIFCGVYALILDGVLSNFTDKYFSRSKSRLLTIFIIGVIFSYIGVNYNIIQFILG